MKQHTHKYKRIVLSSKTGTRVFKCMIPGCHSYSSRNLIIGQKSVCWKCGGELILTSENTELAKPTCLSCRGKKVMTSDGVRVIPAAIAQKIIQKKNDTIDEKVEGFLKSLGLG